MSEQEQTLLSLLEAPEKKAPAAQKKAQPQSQESPALPKDEKTPPQTEEKTAKTERFTAPTSIVILKKDWTKYESNGGRSRTGRL